MKKILLSDFAIALYLLAIPILAGIILSLCGAFDSSAYLCF